MAIEKTFILVKPDGVKKNPSLVNLLTSSPLLRWLLLLSKAKTLLKLFVNSTALPTRWKLFLAPSVATML